MLACGAAMADQKIIERSAKKAPAWVGVHTDGYLSVTVEAPTLSEAEDMAMNLLLQRIANSVATNVDASQTYTIEQINKDGNVQENENFEMVSKIKAANLPFIQGISPAKIEATYWEKLEDKKTHRKSVMYSMLYPFSDSDQIQLKRQFEKIEAEKNAQYQRLEQNYGNIEDAIDIRNAIAELETLEAYYFDASRVKAVQGLKKKYQALYSNITLQAKEIGKNKFFLQALIGGKPMSFASVPKVESNCASAIEVDPANGGFIIRCSTEDCLDEEENYLDVTVRIDNKKYKKRILLK